jgi:putative phage-type endonuclease
MACASLQQRTPAWHAARRGKLTASNVGAALGLCPWTTRQQAFNRAMGLERFVGNDATRWGVANEPNGILAYSAHTGNVVDNTGLHVHKATSWLAGSPDGLVGTEGMLEVKCPFWRKKDGTRVHKEVPSHYYLQINLCLEAAEREWCDFISWSPEGYAIYRITRDNDLHEFLMPHYLKFFAAMQRMATSPPVLGADEKKSLTEAVEASMAQHIDYKFWRNVDASVAPPSPPHDLDADESYLDAVTGRVVPLVESDEEEDRDESRKRQRV